MTTALNDSRALAVPAEMPRVLVADDQPDVLEALRLLLKLEGCASRAVSSPAAVLEALRGGERFDLLVMDLNYARDTTSGDEGLELVAQVRALDPALPIVVMTAWSTVPLAVASMREGVGDFVEKPWDNARLLATVREQVAAGRKRRRAQRIESDAREVQRRLLARETAEVPGFRSGVAWRFAEELGGDLSLLEPLPGGRLGVAIGDVCGKGTPAALLMASTQATLTDLLAQPLGPGALCAQLSAALSPRLGAERFVTLAYAVLDRARRTLTYANAGHPAPVLLRAGGEVRRLERGGPVLGVVKGADYEEGQLALRPGDRLVFFTDGISEATSATAGELGEERLLHWLTELRGLGPGEAAQELLARTRAFAEPSDDATVVVVDVEG